jgi:hypothetical protein
MLAAGPDERSGGWFSPVLFGKPFVAEIHSTAVKVELGYGKAYNEFNLVADGKPFDRPVVELHLGVEIPLYARYGARWGFAATLPVGVHVLEDMFDPVTAPVINTDYRFGGPRFHFIYHLNDSGFLRNLAISWLPIFHECTHLGDEITIYRVEEDLPIRRVNVSYEYTELQLTLNDPAGSRETLHSVRLGAVYRISDRGFGWFSVRTNIEASEAVPLSDSEYRLEFYAQYQFQRADGFLAGPRALNIVSIELRNRLRYGYPIYKKEGDAWVAKEMKETLMLTVNLYFGWKFFPAHTGGSALGFFLHFYRGINPYGQLRNYPSYPFYGLSMTYDF